MEKLIELLNEYSPEDFNWCERDGKIYDREEMYDEADVFVEMGVYIISKQFGFIKWLVGNDKLDLWSNTFTEKEEHYFGEQPDFTFQSVKYTHLLMLLSVSENPIEFLISILK